MVHVKTVLDILALKGNFTDKALDHLGGFDALRILRIYSSQKFSADAMTRLKGRLPDLFTFETQGGNSPVAGMQGM